MHDIGDKLKKLRESNNLTRKEAADRLKGLGIDISDKTLYGYESGRNSANADMFLALCQIYKCSNIMETFSDSVGDVLFTNDEWAMLEKYRSLDKFGQETVDLAIDRETQRADILKAKDTQITELMKAAIPRYMITYYQRMASAGSGDYLFDDLPTDLIAVPDTPMARQADFALGVDGDSMEPTYRDGEKVLVKKMGEIPTGSVGVFLRGNECFIKELGADKLISHNRKCPDVPASEDIRLVGKVLGKVEEI